MLGASLGLMRTERLSQHVLLSTHHASLWSTLEKVLDFAGSVPSVEQRGMLCR